MTDNERIELLNMIQEKNVNPPMDLNANDLKQWLIGLIWGQVDAINTIDKFMEGQKN